MAVIEGEHVGGVVLAAKVAVKLAALVFAHNAHGDFGGLQGFVQRRAQPAGGAVAGQGSAVQGGIGQAAGKLQAQGKFRHGGRRESVGGKAEKAEKAENARARLRPGKSGNKGGNHGANDAIEIGRAHV